MDKQEHFRATLSRLQALCSQKEYCGFDIRKKLQQWDYPYDFDEVLDALSVDDFLSEERYTRAFVNDKLKFAKWGKAKIRYMLRGRQINNNLIDNELQNIDQEFYQQIIADEMAKKHQSLRVSDPYLIEQKLMAFGQQRGYEWDLLRKAVEEILNKK